MKNRALAADYLVRCGHRLKAVDTLFELKSWADVVRQSQEVVELALKGLLRHVGIEVPRVHDVSEILSEREDSFPASLRPALPRLGEISRRMRRDRELAFYGSEDLTPSQFYKKKDAEEARRDAAHVVEAVGKVVVAAKARKG